MSHQMYRVHMVGTDGSPWELLAKSPEHAMATIRKFYPQTEGKLLAAMELTLLGEPITLLHQLGYGDKFAAIIPTNSGKPALEGQMYTRGDFNPALNQYMCHAIDGNKAVYFGPYDKIIRK